MHVELGCACLSGSKAGRRALEQREQQQQREREQREQRRDELRQQREQQQKAQQRDAKIRLPLPLSSRREDLGVRVGGPLRQTDRGTGCVLGVGFRWRAAPASDSTARVRADIRLKLRHMVGRSVARSGVGVGAVVRWSRKLGAVFDQIPPLSVEDPSASRRPRRWAWTAHSRAYPLASVRPCPT